VHQSRLLQPQRAHGPYMGYHYRNYSQIEARRAPSGNLLSSYAKAEAHPLPKTAGKEIAERW